jgi:putative permease
VYTVLVFVLLEFVVEPRLYNRRQYNPLLIALMVLALGEEFGVAGVLMAPPLAAALQILGSHLLQPASTPAAQPVESQVTVLEQRLASVRQLLAQSSEAPAPQLVNMLDRLEALVEKANIEVKTG